jgi:hypothetical protein
MQDKDTIIEIFSGTAWEVGMIVSLFKDADIESFLRNDIGTAYGNTPLYPNDIKVMINATDMKQAAIIVREYISNQKKTKNGLMKSYNKQKLFQ